MSNVLIDRQKIDILANAISDKSGVPITMTLDEMVEAVDGIEAGSAEPVLQAKTYTVDSAGTETITADSGYDGLSEVEVSVPSGSTFGQMLLESAPNISINSSSGKIVADHSTEGYKDPINDGGWIETGGSMQFVTYGSSTYQLSIQAGATITPTESQQTAVTAGKYTTGAVTVNAIPSNYVGSGITQRSSSDLTASGATVTVPSGYYSAQASKAVSSGTAGTPTATKGSVSNHSVTVTPSVTNTTGYITGSTINGTAVTVTASELVSGSDTVTSNDTYDVTNLAELVVNVSGGGSVTITDEANATGTTCVITSGGSPTPSGIPLNTELIDFTKLTEDYAINSSGEAVSAQYYCISDYTAVDPSMTFSYTGCTWYYIGVYNSSKEVIRTFYMYTDGTQDSGNSNLTNGTLSGSKLTGASYVRITGVAVQSQYRLSLIRTA